MLQSDIDDKVITTKETKPKDVFSSKAIVLAVDKDYKTGCYIVKENKITFDNDYNNFKLVTPYYWLENSTHFEYLYEIQRFYDLFIFEDIDSLNEYMSNNELEWASLGY